MSREDRDFDLIRDEVKRQLNEQWNMEYYRDAYGDSSDVDAWLELAKLPEYATYTTYATTGDAPSTKEMLDSMKIARDCAKDRGLTKPMDFLGMRIVEMPKWTRSVDRYRLPDGALVKRGDVLVKTRFITYGPEDIEHLLYLGWISKEAVEVGAFSEEDDSTTAYVVNLGYGPVCYMPKAMLTRCCNE